MSYFRLGVGLGLGISYFGLGLVFRGRYVLF